MRRHDQPPNPPQEVNNGQVQDVIMSVVICDSVVHLSISGPHECDSHHFSFFHFCFFFFTVFLLLFFFLFPFSFLFIFLSFFFLSGAQNLIFLALISLRFLKTFCHFFRLVSGGCRGTPLRPFLLFVCFILFFSHSSLLFLFLLLFLLLFLFLLLECFMA